jgi:hypothetical protein
MKCNSRLLGFQRGDVAPPVETCQRPRLAVWLVEASRATLAGRDLGPMGPITPQPNLGDVRIPRRGLFAVGAAFMTTPTAR